MSEPAALSNRVNRVSAFYSVDNARWHAMAKCFGQFGIL
jgi:hypothetical protein